MQIKPRATIFHGTSSTPNDHWLPWLKMLLQKSDYEVYAPILPNNNSPDLNQYEKFLRNSGWDFADNLLIGHSSGATTILNLLYSEWFPPVEAVVLVGTFLNEKLTKSADWYTPGQFDNLFLDTYETELIKSKVNKFYFVHGSNDPYCDIADAKKLCDELSGYFITIENGHHLGSSSALVELPELSKVLYKDGYL